MCRLFFYMESPERIVPPPGVYPLQRFMEQTYKINSTTSSDRHERYSPKNQLDGYGFVWLTRESEEEREYKRYLSTKTYLEDPKFQKVAKQVQKAAFVLGHLRSSTLGNDIAVENNQPFLAENRIFAHNGFITDFHSRARKTLMREITLENIAKMNGTTDSETLFYWIESLRDNMPPKSSLVSVFKEVARRLNNHHIEYLANLVYIDTELEQAVFLRASSRHRKPDLSLWRNRGIGEWIISTEPVSDTQQIEIPEQTVSVLTMKTGTWRTYNL